METRFTLKQSLNDNQKTHGGMENGIFHSWILGFIGLLFPNFFFNYLAICMYFMHILSKLFVLYYPSKTTHFFIRAFIHTLTWFNIYLLIVHYMLSILMTMVGLAVKNTGMISTFKEHLESK